MADKKNVIIRSMMLGPVGTNCYIAHVEGRSDCVVVDPGYSGERVAQVLTDDGLSLDGVLLTHGHFDHYEGVPGLTAKMGGKVYILDEEMDLIKDPAKNGSLGLMGHGTAIEPEFTCHDGDVLELAGMEFKVIHTPGHTKGGCCYYLEDEGYNITLVDTYQDEGPISTTRIILKRDGIGEDLLRYFSGADVSVGDIDTGGDIQIYVGTDHTNVGVSE